MVAFSRMSVEELREYNAAAQRRRRARMTGALDAEPRKKSGPRQDAPLLGDGPILTAGNNASARPSEQLIADARRRRCAPMSITGALMGDPPPGQSALDKRMSV